LPQEREAPTITVEFVSQDKRSRIRDYETKRHEYRSIGVREYWIIDRFDRTMTVHKFERSKVDIETVTAEQSYTTQLLPGFELPLSKLLQLADRWGDRGDE
jgi:Uma2 family endonuclease